MLEVLVMWVLVLMVVVVEVRHFFWLTPTSSSLQLDLN